MGGGRHECDRMRVPNRRLGKRRRMSASARALMRVARPTSSAFTTGCEALQYLQISILKIEVRASATRAVLITERKDPRYYER